MSRIEEYTEQTSPVDADLLGLSDSVNSNPTTGYNLFKKIKLSTLLTYFNNFTALISKTTNPADAGQMRLAKSDTIEWRNAANGDNVYIEKDASDDLSIVKNLEASSKILKANDVVNDLTTNSATVPLSAAQGVVLRGDVDTNITNSTDLFRNAIINPIDENMVDQYGNSGLSSFSSGDYLLDRWYLDRNPGATSPQFDIGASTVKLTAQAVSESTVMVFIQRIEDVNYKRLDGKQVTFSASIQSNQSNTRLMVTTDGGTNWYSSSTYNTGTGGFQTLSITRSSAQMTGITGLFVLIGTAGLSGTTLANTTIAQNDYVEFKNAQATLGDTVLPYIPRSYGIELALCQRYYYKFTPVDGDQFTFGRGISSGNTLDWSIITPVPMQGTPSFSIARSGGLDWNCAGSGGSLTSISVAGISVNNVMLTGNTGAAISNQYSASVGWSGGIGDVILDSEL